jgi:hypothetical protein
MSSISESNLPGVGRSARLGMGPSLNVGFDERVARRVFDHLGKRCAQWWAVARAATVCGVVCAEPGGARSVADERVGQDLHAFQPATRIRR